MPGVSYVAAPGQPSCTRHMSGVDATARPQRSKWPGKARRSDRDSRVARPRSPAAARLPDLRERGGATPSAGLVAITLARHGSRARFTVADSGEGIAPGALGDSTKAIQSRVSTAGWGSDSRSSSISSSFTMARSSPRVGAQGRARGSRWISWPPSRTPVLRRAVCSRRRCRRTMSSGSRTSAELPSSSSKMIETRVSF